MLLKAEKLKVESYHGRLIKAWMSNPFDNVMAMPDVHQWLQAIDSSSPPPIHSQLGMDDTSSADSQCGDTLISQNQSEALNTVV